MQSQLSEISPVEVQLDLVFPWDEIVQPLEAAFERASRNAKVRGFRPGRAPKKLVRQMVGRRVRSEVANSLVQKGLMQAVQEHDLHVVAMPQLTEMGEVQEGAAFNCQATVEVQPKVEQVDWQGMAIYHVTEEVTEADVDAALAKLRVAHADVRAPESARPAQSGDRVKVSLRVVQGDADDTEDGDTTAAEAQEEGERKPATASPQTQTIDLDDEEVLPEVRTGLLGMQVGEHKRIELAPNTDSERAGEDNAAAARRHLDVTVEAIWERLLPELDDDFAADCGDFETLAQLRQHQRDRLQSEVDAKREAALTKQVCDTLVARNPVPVAPALVNEHISYLNRDTSFIFNLAMRQHYENQGRNEEPESLLHLVEREARKQVRQSLLLGAVARLENLEVSDAEVDARLAAIAVERDQPAARVRAAYQGERRDNLKSEMLRRKVVDHILAQAQLLEGEPPASAEAATP
ncbi:MAG: trigger factor [Polyangiales bacterium]